MADKYWIGGDTGNEYDWATAANWSPSGVPIAGDNVYITSQSIFRIDGYDASAVDLGNVYIDDGYVYDIGDYNSGSPSYLKLAFQTDKTLNIKGDTAAQQCWIEVGGSNAIEANVRDYGLIEQTSLGKKGVHLKESGLGSISLNMSGGTVSVDSGGISSAVVTDGQLEVTTSNFFGSLYVSGSGASVAIRAGVIPTTIQVTAGTLTVSKVGDSTGSVLLLGGTINWDGGTDISSLLTIRAGFFNLANAARRAVIEDIEIEGDGILDMGNAVGGATITNNIKVHGNPQIVFPDNALLSLAS